VFVKSCLWEFVTILHLYAYIVIGKFMSTYFDEFEIGLVLVFTTYFHLKFVTLHFLVLNSLFE
jgi:hypothetical protein